MPSSPESTPEPIGPDSSTPESDETEGIPYRELFEAHPHPMFVFDVETLNFLMVNEAATLRYGYSRQEFNRMTLRDIRPPEEVEGMEQVVRGRREGLTHVEGPWQHRTRDGRTFPVEITSQPFMLRGRAARLVQARDVSDRVAIQKEQDRLLERERQARTSAQQTEARFRQAFDGAAMGIVIADADGEIRYANPTILRILGYTLDEFLALDPRDLTHPDDRDGNLAGILEIREGFRDSFVVEKRYLRKDGTPLWVRSSVSALRNPQGEITDYLGVIQDLSSEMEALERLDFSRRLVAMAGRIAKLGGWAIDFRTNTVYWSDEVAAIHEEPPGTAVSIDKGIEYYAPEWRPVIRKHFTACVQEGTPYDLELEIITRTGRRVWVRTTGEAVQGPDGETLAVQGAFRDISREREIRAALEAGEERFRAVARATVDAAFDYDLEDRSVWWSEGVEEVFGYTPSEMGSDPMVWEGRIHPEDRQQVRGAARRAEMGDGDISELEYRFRRKDGTYVLVSDRAWILRNEDGGAIRKVGGIRDITEQRRMERHYLRTQRMESLGTLAGGSPMT
jgi:PAS domain S-box-containing protein